MGSEQERRREARGKGRDEVSEAVSATRRLALASSLASSKTHE